MEYQSGRLPLGLSPGTRNSLLRMRQRIALDGPQGFHALCGLVVAREARTPADTGQSDAAAREAFVRYCIDNDWLRPVPPRSAVRPIGISHERKSALHLGP